MSLVIYHRERPLVWLAGAVRSPPFTAAGRLEAGRLLRTLQGGGTLSLPHSRPMPVIGRRCHELRVRDVGHDWRIVYHLGTDAIVILEVFAKRTRATPDEVIAVCRQRLSRFLVEGGEG